MKRMYTAGATAGRLLQSLGPFPSTYSPVCNGLEANLSGCHQMIRNSEAYSVGRVYVTCFVNDPLSGECNIEELLSTTAPSGIVSEFTATTSVIPPSRFTTSANSTDSTSSADTSGFVTIHIVSVIGGPGSNKQSGVDIIMIIIAACVVGTFVLSLLVTIAVMLIIIIRLRGCKSHLHSHTRVHETDFDSVDNINESALYSDLIDAPIQQNQQEIPVYETIMTKSEIMGKIDEADKPTTNTCQVDLKDNIAYESSSITTQANEAYGASTCPVDLKENVAYETSSSTKNYN